MLIVRICGVNAKIYRTYVTLSILEAFDCLDSKLDLILGVEYLLGLTCELYLTRELTSLQWHFN